MEKRGPDTSLTLFDDASLYEAPLKHVALLPPEDYVPEILPGTGNALKVTINKEHAYEVLDRLITAYEANEAPYSYDRTRVPQDPRHMPQTLERGTTEHAMFFFNTCYYMRGGIKSNDAVQRLSGIFDEWPELFNAETAQYFDVEVLKEILTQHGLGFQPTVAPQWIENARRLHENFDGDPRNLFDEDSTYEQSQKRIQNDGKGNGFIGFQEKMTSMIIYYLMDENLIKPFNFPVPVDLHVMRVSIANEMILFDDAPYGTNLFTKDTLAKLRDLYFTYAEERNVNPLRLCDAVWMLSESSCGRNPGNTTIEPLGRQQRNGRATYLIPKEVDTSDPAQQAAYASSCAVCPIEKTCEYNIPGTQYYVSGGIIIRGRRVRFPLPLSRPQTLDIDV